MLDPLRRTTDVPVCMAPTFRSRSPPTRTNAADERAFYKCLSAKVPSSRTQPGHRVHHRTLEVDSSADVYRTAAAAKADLKLANSAKTPAASSRRPPGSQAGRSHGPLGP